MTTVISASLIQTLRTRLRAGPWPHALQQYESHVASARVDFIRVEDINGADRKEQFPDGVFILYYPGGGALFGLFHPSEGELLADAIRAACGPDKEQFWNDISGRDLNAAGVYHDRVAKSTPRRARTAADSLTLEDIGL